MNRSNVNTSGSRIILLTDCVSITVSYFLAAWIRGGLLKPHFFAGSYALMYVVTILAYATLYAVRSRSNIFKRDFINEIVNVLREQVELLVVLMSVLFITKQQDYSRIFLLIFLIVNIVLIYVARSYVKVFMLLGYKRSKFSNKIVLITQSNLADKIIKKIKSEYYFNFIVDSIAIMDKSMLGSKFSGVTVIANKENLLEVMKKAVVDEVFIHLPEYTELDTYDLVLELEKMGIMVHLNLDIENKIKIHEKRISVFAGHYVITYSSKLFDEGQIILKRSIDIVGGIVGLLITGLLTLILSPFIYFESKGPIFFSQIRIGKNGRQFKIYKFRSMYADAEERKKELMEKNEMKGLMFKMTDDPRITKIGKFIRKTSLDEFPQFLNVLKGDMSLVGTRPPTLDEFNEYEGRHKRRLSLKPGLTGLWQVSGRSDISDFEEVVRLDLEYIDNWSLGLDLKLILRTIKVVLFGRGSK